MVTAAASFLSACASTQAEGPSYSVDAGTPEASRMEAPLGPVEVPPFELQENPDGTMSADVTAEALFDLNSSQLKPEASSVVDGLVDKLQTGTYSIRVDGYTDGLGRAEHNQQLSLNRARAVAVELQSRGLASQIVSCGRGEEGSDGESEDPMARRVVITLSEVPFPEDCS